jgi:hypothetical protein
MHVTGSDIRNTRAVKPRMWQNNVDPTRCPIATYLVYKDKRPAQYCSDDDPFYIATNSRLSNAEQTPSDTDKWYRAQPIGVNKLGSIMSKMSEKAGIRRLTNHSARKHLVQKLNDAGVPANQIMQITGHKNIHSINNYSTLSINQHRDISHIIAQKQPTNPQPTSTSQPQTSTSQPQASTSQPQASTSQHQASTPQLQTLPKELFHNCQMRIDNMTINIVKNYDKPEPPPLKRRRINVIESDSD